MSCFHPKLAVKPPSGRLYFGHAMAAHIGKPGYDAIEVPCGQCINCRLEHSRQWAIRCEHEASLYEDNCFITLTYAPEHLPVDGSLVPRDFTLFMKRLRKKYGEGIRYYGCGEYGEKFARPHYHACLFNFNFNDRVLFKKSGKFSLYISEALSTLWPFGHSTVAEFSFETAAYVSRYVTKKVSGNRKDEHYVGRVPEFSRMSRNPGLGYDFFIKYYDDIVNYDHVVIRNGRIGLPPKYYDKLLAGCDYELFLRNKQKRLDNLKATAKLEDATRNTARERHALLKFKKLIRSYEDDKA